MNAPGIRLGSIAGTAIYVQTSFLILVALFVILDVDQGRGIHMALLWIPVLLISVLVHELAHAGAIALFGHGRSLIILGGFGGVTINERRARPWQDMLISLAGPFSSFALAILVWITYVQVPALRSDPMMQALAPLLRDANFFWGFFNLLPIHPLDGGSAFRSFLRLFTQNRRAELISIWLSLILGALLIAGSLFARQLFLAAIAAMLTMQNYQRWQQYKASDSWGE